jgi:Tol biopolymer transport system component
MRFSDGKNTISQRAAMAMVALVALVVVASLTGCSSSGSRGRYLSYVQGETNDAVVRVAHPQAHAAVNHPAVTAGRAFPASTVVISGITPVAGDQDLYIYDTATQTTKDELPGYYFESTQISHDDTKIVDSVYTPIAAGSSTAYYQLWLGDKDGKTITQITTDATEHYDATFSADGSMIAYWAYDATADLTQLFTISTTAPYTITEIKTPTLDAYYPVFTPDGLSLVFEGNPLNDTDAIYSLKIATGASSVTQLSLPVQNSTVDEYDYYPSVSPDGTQVSFTRNTYTIASDTNTYDIYVMPIAGETASPAKGLTTGLVTAGMSEQPLYLDNSNENIVYLSWEPNSGTTGNPNIFEMNRDGSITGLAKTQLTSTTMADYFYNEQAE